MALGIAIVSFIAFLALSNASTQSLSVRGTLTCNGKPYSGAKLKLYDSNTLWLDSKMAQVNSDAQGHFQLTGTTSNMIFSADPKFNIYHRCGKTLPVCYYKSSYNIPKSYVTSGSVPSKVYDAQTIELTMLKKSRDCLN